MDFLLSISLFTIVISHCFGAQYFVSQEDPFASDDNQGTKEKPFKTISKAVSVLKEGDSVIVGKGVYRERVVLPSGKVNSPVSIEAAIDQNRRYEEVFISGADILSNWNRLGDTNIWAYKPWEYVWVGWNEDMSHGAPPPVGRCEQVIVDGKLLRPVMSIDDMREGTFFADPKNSKSLYVMLEGGEDPNKHIVEASVRDVLLILPDYAHARGLIFRHAANRAQQGAVVISGKGVLMEDCIVEWTNGSGISIEGENFILRRVISRYNGQLGMGGSGKNALIEECSFENNNIKGFPTGWEAGGFKIVQSWGVKVEGCRAVDNRGPGMWFDILNRACEVRRCYCADNDNSGIFVEISEDFLITDNLCVNNGNVMDDWSGAGICIAESEDCYVAFNTCVGNQYGISIRGQVPRPLDRKPSKDRGITIRNNIMAYNQVAQFGLLWDQPFMGRHPSERDMTEEEWQKVSQDSIDPDTIGLILDYNLYYPGSDSEIIRWGVSWRPKWKSYKDLKSFTSEHGLETHGKVKDPGFTSYRERNFSLADRAPVVSKDRYINYGIRYPVSQLLR